MGTWFTVEAIGSDTFAISEYNHWEETHCYLVCGTERALLIDTGLGVGNIREMVDGLTDLPVTVVTTHVHWDHIGGHRFFDRIAVHEAEKDWLAEQFPIPLEVVKHNLTCLPCDFPEDFALDDYRLFQGTPQEILHDGDCLPLGDRTLTVIHTPGHSTGHCYFYEPERKYLFFGDLIYRDCLDAFYPTTDSQLFWQSVRKVQDLEISRILPGHHELSVPVDIVGRIEKAFRELSQEGKLRQGGGVFQYAGNLAVPNP